MDVITKDYQGKSRRNGGKLKLTTFDKLVILFVLVSLLTGGATWYALTGRTLTALASEVEASTGADIRQDRSITIIETKLDEFSSKQVIMDARQMEMLGILYEIKGRQSQ